MIPFPDNSLSGGYFDDYFGETGYFGSSADSDPHRAQPVFFFTFLPHYFPTGVAPASGTFVNMSFIAPGRLQVDEGAGYASWTSPTLKALVGYLPTPVTPAWDLNSPGFENLVEYRTAATEALLADAAWATLVNGVEVSLNRYYQWRVTWVTFRGWAYDTEEEAAASDAAACALDAADPEDPFESFAADTAFEGTAAYIETVRFSGIFEIDQADIKDPGSFVEECPGNLGDLVAGDHTLILGNRDNKYSPLHANFIFGGEENWKKKHLLIEMAYRLPTGVLTERLVFYEGIIQSWGPAPHLVDEKGKLQEHAVTVYTRDIISDLMDLKIGTPGANGKPAPLVLGEVFRQADQLADETLGDPDAAADFESGDTESLAGVDSSSGGIVSVESTDPIDDGYYFHTEISAASAFAKGRLDLAIAGNEVLFTALMRFGTLPQTPVDKNMNFMGLYNAAGTEIFQLFVGSDFRVYAYAAGEYKETEWYVNRDVGVIKIASIAVSGAAAGTIKIFLNSNEVLTWDADWSALSIKGGYIGPHNGGAAEAWIIDSDAWQIFPNWWPQLYRVPGGPYESIGTVYVDGALKVGAQPLYTNMNRRGLRYGGGSVPVAFVGGITQTTGVEKFPEYGALAFTDYANKVSGTVTAYFRKNDVTHPVDAVRAILAAKGKEGYLDETAAAAAKTATPDDMIAGYFDNVTMGDAIKALSSTCIFSLFRSQNMIKIMAYTGIAPTAYDLELVAANHQGVAPAINEEGMKNQVFVKYGQYDRNYRLSYTAKDEASIAYHDIYDTEIDLSWGSGMVGTDNGAMAIRNAQKLLRRLVGGQLIMDETPSTLMLMRLQVGDVVRVNSPAISVPVLMNVAKKTVNCNTPKGVRLLLRKFLGEETAA